MRKDMEKAILQIARNMPNPIETLERQYSDSLDFHDIAVWTLKDALEAAYMAGAAAAENFRGDESKPEPAPKIKRTRLSAYDRTKAQVYATGNRHAIENFHATHD